MTQDTGEPVIIPTEEDYFGVYCAGAARAVWAAELERKTLCTLLSVSPLLGLAAAWGLL